MFFTRIVNSLLSIFGLRIVRESILYDWQTGETDKKYELCLPEEGAEYLTIDNPRLEELRQRYSQFQLKACIPIVWTDEYVQSYDLLSFRGDNCYVWQTKDPNCDEINYCLTAYYVKAIDGLGLLQKNNEDGLFGVYTYTVDSQVISRDLLDSIIELNFLEKHLDLSQIPNLKILDIGAGYGRLAYRAASSFSNLMTYLCTDAVPESTFLSEYHIKFRHIEDKVSVIPLDNIAERLQEQQIDLAVNIHSFSECSLEAIDWWLALLSANKVKNLFIVPNAAGHGGEKLALNNGVEFSVLVEKYGYKLYCKSPKYEDPVVQKFGVSPTYFYLYQLTE
ncbi:MAG: putative sugar O-methyltransferase [Proteobacteria bacterium]|nr:putative sugar O-methyltransferase [Pseudomonadota bacterium]MBU1650475.1 putative sugar O-methyltransferase [Pseudomonadota bacterium]